MQFCPGMSKGFITEKVYVHSMLRRVKLCALQTLNHVAHLLLYSLRLDQLHQALERCMNCNIYCSRFIPSSALFLTCLGKVSEMINTFTLHFQHKQPTHYSCNTLNDALIITTELGKTLVYLIFWNTCKYITLQK